MVATAEALRSFCLRLRRLRLEAGGPTIDSLARNDAVPLGRSQLYAVLNGDVKEPPQWDFVRPYVETCVAYARRHGNALSVPDDPQVWRAELHALVELADAERRRRGEEPAPVALPVPLATESLPPDVAGFVGRQAELAQLLAGGEKSADDGESSVFLIDGMAGAGKTALAVHAAHRLGDRYPDGRLFLNLCGHRPDRAPLTPGEALASLLGAVGVPAAVMPADVDARAAVWRHQMRDKRFLLLLDDAADAGQVQPLMPSAPGSLVLITSRNRMPTMIHARPLRVDTLTAEEAYDLFVAIAGGDRAKESDDIRAVVARCGRLPLPIALVAARLRTHPSWTVERLLQEMGQETGAAHAAFDVSYRALDPTLRESFRRLSVHPGADLDAWAAAAILGAEVGDAAARLEDLYRDHLLDEARQDRFRFHDLVREYAIGRDDDPGERSAAEGRLLRYFLATARRAGVFHEIRPRPGGDEGTPGPRVDTLDSATRWLRTEIGNIALSVAQAWARHPETTVALTDAIFPYVRQAGPWDMALDIYDVAVRAAHRTGDPRARSTALLEFGVACVLADRYPEAVAALRESAGLAPTGLDRADALTQLGMALRFDGQFAAAIGVLNDAIGRYAELGDATGETQATYTLAVTYRFAGDYRTARDLAERAVATSRRSTYLPARAIALSEFGVTQYLLARYEDAAVSLTSALDLARGLENRLGEATALNYLGAAQYLGGDPGAAVDSLTRALALFRQLGERLGSADALSQLGVARLLAGELETAAALQRQAIEEFRELGNELGEAVARNELGTALRGLRREDEARAEIVRAVETLRRLGYRPGLEEALNNLGRTELGRGRPGEALRHHEEALALNDDTGIPLERARAREGIGRSLAATGDGRAEEHLRAALTAYEQVKSPLARALRRDFPALG